ncbi:MAG TPA: FecR domain-containing protein [Bacteroidales bacterium]|nr:FecR domain-containing protein [Bacteroidales bacterium]
MKQFSHIDQTDLITRYLAQESTSEENEMLQQWLASSSENVAYFNRLKEIWDDTNDHSSLNLKHQTLQAWADVNTRMKEGKAKTIRSIYVWAASVAASVLILLGIGFYFIHNAHEEVSVASTKKILKITMPDKSVVWLNRNSELIYDKATFAHNRRVKFSGEGYFEIQPDSANRFEIQTSNATITVLGTRFNVKANPKDSLTEVVVKSGKVRLTSNAGSTKEKKEIVLTAGEKGSSRLNDMEPQKKLADDPNYLSWKTHEFTFNNTNIRDIVNIINEIYSVNVVLAEGNTENCNLTGRYSWQSIDDILNMLQIVLNIEVKRSGDDIIIKTNGC